MAQPQVNVRVSAEALETLEAAAFVQRKSVGELVRGHVESVARGLRTAPGVAAALRGREESGAAEGGKVTTLNSKRKPREATDA
jgi:hypothetical protein